ncbi:MAG: hypothetical protein V1794_12710 [Candidatus Glassbacteria bacterium]
MLYVLNHYAIVDTQIYLFTQPALKPDISLGWNSQAVRYHRGHNELAIWTGRLKWRRQGIKGNCDKKRPLGF